MNPETNKPAVSGPMVEFALPGVAANNGGELDQSTYTGGDDPMRHCSPCAPVAQTPLEKAQQVMAERRAAGIAVERLDPIEKARRNPKSLRLAINAFCCTCMGGSDESGWKGQIRDCTSLACPLYIVRPYQSSDEEEAS